MRGILYNFALDVREAFSRNFSLHIGTDLTVFGLYIRLPFSPWDAWLEWRDQWVGFGSEVTPRGTDREFFLGRLQGVVGIDPRVAR